jgi:hypothetical protein
MGPDVRFKLDFIQVGGFLGLERAKDINCVLVFTRLSIAVAVGWERDVTKPAVHEKTPRYICNIFKRRSGD